MSDRLMPDPVALRQRLGLLTEEEVAALAEIEMRTLKNWQVDRRGPAFSRFGKAVVYREEAVMEWLREREKETQP